MSTTQGLFLTSSDIAQDKNEVVQKQQQQQVLQPDIQDLSLVLQDLSTRHDQLGKDVELANASIAPIRKLPVDTLSSIFEFCARQEDNAPLCLSRVCQKWRVAATSPRIWSRIVVDLEDRYAPSKVQLYLNRSRKTLLDIELLKRGFTGSGCGAWHRLLSHKRRWRSLEISACTYGQVNDILNSLPISAPNLVHTSVTVEGFFFTEPEPDPFEFRRLELPLDFLGYSSFRSLRLQIWTLPMFTVTPCPVLAQLTTLHIVDTYASAFRLSDYLRPHPICGDAIFSILSLCSRLETFTFDARNSVEHHSGKCCPRVDCHHTLATLQHISLIAHHLDTFAILERVVLPALRTAHIEPLPRDSSGLTDAFGVAFSDLVRRSAPPLEELSLSAMAPQDLVWILERSPRLKQLRLYCTNPAPVIKALSAPYVYEEPGRFVDQPRWVCPELSRLYFNECFDVPWRDVARLIQHRHRAYLDKGNLALMVDLVVNAHDVFEDRHLDSLVTLEVSQIATLIEP